MIKQKKGITLIALTITIVIILILAGITVRTIINGGIIGYAERAKLKADVISLKDAINKRELATDDEIKDGKINKILEIESIYNDKLQIENGKLVYISSKWSEDEIKTLEEIGIGKSFLDIYIQNADTFYIATEETANSDIYDVLDNMGTLQEFRDLVNAGNFKYEKALVIEDINLNEGKYSNIDGEIVFADDAEQWIPIEDKFKVLLDGQQHKITGLYLEDNDSTTGINLGLFAELDSQATIQNLSIKDSSIKGYRYIGSFAGKNHGKIENCDSYATLESSFSSIGGICGSNETQGIVSNCHFDGYAFMKTGTTYGALGGIAGNNNGNIINSYNKATLDIGMLYHNGGIAGSNGGTIMFCYNEGKITGTRNAYGGIAGYNSGTIEKCYNTGSVGKGYKSVGGIAGDATATSNIRYCYNIGEITSSSNSTGGVAGSNVGNVEYCYNSGDISSQSQTGGIAGANSGTVKACYNKGTAKATIYFVGGIVGSNESSTKTPTISNCYNVGQVIKSATSYTGAGQITGKNGTTGIIKNSYILDTLQYDVTDTNNGTITDCASKTEIQMKTQDKSFILLLNSGLTEDVWVEKENDFPILSWQVQ